MKLSSRPKRNAAVTGGVVAGVENTKINVQKIDEFEN